MSQSSQHRSMSLLELLRAATGSMPLIARSREVDELQNRLQNIDVYRAGGGRIIEIRTNPRDCMTITMVFVDVVKEAAEAYNGQCHKSGLNPAAACVDTGVMDSSRRQWTPELENAHRAAVIQSLEPFN